MEISYKLNGPDESYGLNKFDDSNGRTTTFDQLNVRLWDEYEAWKALGNTPDPQYTTEEQAQIDYQARQDARIANLKSALINQFKMILALFQVGRDNGVWTVSDFDSELVTIAQQWIALIDEYENDAP